jgi:hypothetical protein
VRESRDICISYEWRIELRLAGETLEKAYPLSYGLSFEPKVAVVGSVEVLERFGEPAGIRTQDPRLKRAMLYRLSYRLTDGC